MKLELNNFITYAEDNLTSPLFEVEHASFIAGKMNIIKGESGCGKTSLLNIFAFFSNKYNGTILFDNKPYVKDNVDVSYMTSDLCFILELTVVEFLHIVTTDDAKIDKLLDKLQINDIKNKKLSKCSRGQQTRASICAILLKDSDLYLFDEPTANVDKFTKQIVKNILVDFSKTHFVIISSHDDVFFDENFIIYEIKDKELKLITDTDSVGAFITEPSKARNKKYFPFFAFLTRCGFHHKIWLAIAFVFLFTAISLSFVSMSFQLIDKNKTLETAISSLPNEYYQINNIYEDEIPSQSKYVYTTRGSIKTLQSPKNDIYFTCAENLNDGTFKKCTRIFNEFEKNNSNLLNDSTFPIILTTEQIDYLNENNISTSIGSEIPVSIVNNSFALPHNYIEDKFVLSGIIDLTIDYVTKEDNDNFSLRYAFPAIIKKKDYITCLSHSGFRSNIFVNSLSTLYKEYKTYCDNNTINLDIIDVKYLTLYNIYPYSFFDKVNFLNNISNIQLSEDFILLPKGFKYNNILFDAFNNNASTNSFLDKYKNENNEYHFPLTSMFKNADQISSFSIAGQYEIIDGKNDSLTFNDCIIVSNKLYDELISAISLGYMDGYDDAKIIFADKTYLKEHLNQILDDSTSLQSIRWTNCLKSYKNSQNFRTFITIVAAIISLISIIIFIIYGINERRFLTHNFAVLKLLGKKELFCFFLFTSIITTISLFSLLISIPFCQLVTNALFHQVCNSIGYDGTFVVSNFALSYAISIIVAIVIPIISIPISYFIKKKNPNSQIKEGD